MSSYVIREKDEVYFLTSTIVGWVDVFTRKIYRDIILESFTFCRAKKNLRLHAFVIMSNHIHWIASTANGTELDGVVRDFKTFTSKKIIASIQENETESRKEWMLNLFGFAGRTHTDNKEFKFWQSGNHPVNIYSDEFFEQKLKYIHTNPVRAGWVDMPEDYIYSSARDYQGLKGLIEIDAIIITKFGS